MRFYIGDQICYTNLFKEPYVYGGNPINVLSIYREYVSVIGKDESPEDGETELINGSSIPLDWIDFYEE